MDKILKLLLLSIILVIIFFPNNLKQKILKAQETYHFQTVAPFEFYTHPAKIYLPNGTGKIILGVRGNNGFSGNVTISFSGLPDFVLECGSNCDPSGASGDGDGRAPFNITAVNNEWRMFAPNILNYNLPTSVDYRVYSLTVTATASGYTPVSHLIPVVVSPTGPRAGGEPGRVDPATLQCWITAAMESSGYTQPFRPSNKQAVNSGGSKSYSCNMRVSGYLSNWVDGTVGIFRTNSTQLAASNINASVLPTSSVFNAPSEAREESHDVILVLTLSTNSSTPSGVYVATIDQTGPTGYEDYFYSDMDAVLTSTAVSNSSSNSNSNQTNTSNTSSSSNQTTSSNHTSTENQTSNQTDLTNKPTSTNQAPIPKITLTVNNIIQEIEASISSVHLLPKSSIKLSVKPSYPKAIKNIKVEFDNFTTNVAKNESGSYTYSFETSANPGNYKSKITVTYQDGTTEEKLLDLLIDPSGFIYEKKGSQEIKISSAEVKLMERFKDTWQIWDAAKYNQSNPQITSESGEYSFFVPIGTYKLKVEKQGYEIFESEPIVVQNQPIVLNIELKSTSLAEINTNLSTTKNKSFQSQINAIVSEPVFKTTSNSVNIVTPIVVTSGVILPFLANNSIIELFDRLLAWLLVLAGFKRRRLKPWGRVLDSESGQGISLALVKVLNEEGKVLDSQLTDNKGQFIFMLPNGVYQLQVYKANYSFPSKITSNGYHGGKITVSNSSKLSVEIYLDSELTKVSQRIFKIQNLVKLIGISRQILVWLGLVLSLLYLIANPSIWHISISLIYGLIIGIEIFGRFLLKPTHGLVLDQSTHQGINLAIVRLINDESNKLVATKVTNNQGAFLLKLSPGCYISSVTCQNYLRFTDKSAWTLKSDAVLSKRYYLKHR